LRVKDGSRVASLRVAADQSSLVSRSGSVLVAELAARLGVEKELSRALGHLFRRRPMHDPGRVLVDLATVLIDGGDCVSDLGVLAEQPDLVGRVASDSTATWLVYALGEREPDGIREARRRARERASALGARPESVTLDFGRATVGVPHREGGRRPAPQGRLRRSSLALFR